MTNRVLVLVSFVCMTISLAGCGNDDSVPNVPDESDNCPAIFQQSVLATWKVQISDGEWAKLNDEFVNHDQRVAQGLPEHPYHPIQLTYDDGKNPGVDVANAQIRLKGNSSWAQTLQLDKYPKMQFVIAFDNVDTKARFMGEKKVDLDMPRTDRSFLRQRLALYALRQLGVPAQCGNSARVDINGRYYGLYANSERIDKNFFKRWFPGADNGDLWAGGRTIKNNETTFTYDRLNQFWAMDTNITGLEQITDLDDSVKEWAAEAVIGDADGYYNGRPNFYLYDHPSKGFMWLAADLDTVFDMDFLTADASLTFPPCTNRVEDDRRHWALVLATPRWLDKYIAAIDALHQKYDVGGMQHRLELWEKQIRKAASDDPHKSFTMADHDLSVSLMHDFMSHRADYVESWLKCRSGGGQDADGDGFDFCNDCDDKNAQVNPGQEESCNKVDDNCDGLVDDMADGKTCQ